LVFRRVAGSSRTRAGNKLSKGFCFTPDVEVTSLVTDTDWWRPWSLNFPTLQVGVLVLLFLQQVF
jgi:hypothetical protein